MGKLEDDDKAFCASHGLIYVPPESKISLRDFEREQHYQNQGPRQGEPKMWTPGKRRYENDGDKYEPDTTTSGSELGKMLVVIVLLVTIAVGLMGS